MRFLRRGLLATAVVCLVLVGFGVLVGSVWSVLSVTVAFAASLLQLLAWFGDSAVLSQDKTLDLLKKTTARRISIASQTTAASDDRPIPWEALDGPARDAAGAVLGSDAFERLHSAKRPVVVVGPEGAGKSTLARRLAVERSIDRERAVIYVSLAGWDPSFEAVDWTAMEIATVMSRRWGEKVAQRHVRTLLSNGQVDVVFDGLDEAFEGSAKTFVDSLSISGMTGWFLFTRFDSADLLPSQDRTVHDVLRLRPLPVEVVTGALEAFPGEWPRVAARIESSPDDDLPRLLRTPMFLTIAEGMARAGAPPPAQLMTIEPGASSAHEAASSLMRWLVTSALERPGVSKPKLRRRWLENLARMDQRTNRDDIAWWDLARAAPWVTVVTLGTAIAFLSLAALERVAAWSYGRTSLPEALGPWQSSGTETAVAFAAAALLAGLSGSSPREAPRWVRAFRSGPLRIGVTMGVLGAWQAQSEGASWPQTALGASVIGGLTALTAWMIGTFATSVHRWLARIGVAQSPAIRPFPRRLGLTFTWSRLLLSVGLGLLFPLLYFLQRLSPAAAPLTSRPLVAHLLTGCIVAAASFVLLSLGAPGRSQRDHRKALIGNAAFGAIIAIVGFGVLIAVAVVFAWLIDPPSATSAPLDGGVDFKEWFVHADQEDRALALVFILVTMGLAVLGCATVGVLASSAGRYSLNLTVLAMARRLPWHLGAFLEWGCETGILRKTGQTYTFRHESIRRHLDPDPRRERAGIGELTRSRRGL